MSKIVSLQAENVKRIKAVHIEPTGELVIIGGNNEAGKTSVLDSIAYALGGKGLIADRPIRDGEDEAVVTIETNDHTIVRQWVRHPDGGTRTSLKVTASDGKPVSSPQKLLDNLVGPLSFDPLEFSRMTAKLQAQTLTELVGLDLSDLEQAHDNLFNERADENRTTKRIEGQLAGDPGFDDQTPDGEIEVAALLAQSKEARDLNLKRDQLQKACETKADKYLRLKQHVENEHARLKVLIANCYLLKKQMELAATSIMDENIQLEELTEKLANTPEADVQGPLDKIAEADAINACVRAKVAYAALAEELKTSRKNADQLTAKLKINRKEQTARIAAAPYPIEGLSLESDRVMLNGLPFDQASGAQKLRLSVAMGLALNPELRVLLVRDGSLLDADSLEIIRLMAAEADAQVWIERVGEGAEATVIIEDGEVRGDSILAEAESHQANEAKQ